MPDRCLQLTQVLIATSLAPGEPSIDVLHPLGMRRLVLLPQQRQRHPLAAKLAVNLAPLRCREPCLARQRRRPREQPPLELSIIERFRQRPSHPLRLSAQDVLPHRRWRCLHTSRNRPDAQPCGVVQPQDLSNLAHGQPPLRHRDALPKGREGPTVSRLSRVAQLRVSDPSRRSSAYPENDRLRTGISDRFTVEQVIGLEWKWIGFDWNPQARSSWQYCGGGVLAHPSYQGVCEQHGTEDLDVTPGGLVMFPGGTGTTDPISGKRSGKGRVASNRTTTRARS